MNLHSSIHARLVRAFMSLLILFCSTLPASGQCPMQGAVSASIKQKEQSCCKGKEGQASESKCSCCEIVQQEVLGTTLRNQDCWCKASERIHDAIFTSIRSQQDSNWAPGHSMLAPPIGKSSYFADKHRHCVRKVASSFAPTGPPLYLLHRALLL